MTATDTTVLGTRDRFLRLAMRADALITGLTGLAGLPLAGWLAGLSGTTPATEYALSAFFVGYGVVVYGLAALPAVRGAGIAVVAANVLYTVAAVAVVAVRAWPLTTVGVVLTLASGVYTLVFAELQYQGLRRLRA